MSRPSISVIIPHLNQLSGLEACLESLHAQSLEPSQFEVVVVDNGSSAMPEVTVARFPNARLISELKSGPGPARNLGAQAANGKIFCFIDADCRAHPDWLSVALRTLCAAPKGTILGGDVQIWCPEKLRFTAFEAYESIFAYVQKRYIEEHGFSGTGNLAMYRADFYKVGPFAGIELAEDMDWGRRARDLGFTFRYVPEMIVFHPARQSFRELCVKWDRHLQHYLNMAQGRRFWRLRWGARALAILASPVVDGHKVFTSARIHGASARAKALSVLIAIRTYRAGRMLMLLWSSAGVVWNREAKPVGDPD